MPTSGPIVRTGTTPEFWKNWDNIFGEKSKSATAKKAGAKAKKSGASAKAASKPATAGKKSPAKSTSRKKTTKK